MIPLLMTGRGRAGRDAVEFVNASSIESVTTTPVVVVCRVPDDDPAEGNRKCHNGRALGQTRAQAVRALRLSPTGTRFRFIYLAAFIPRPPACLSIPLRPRPTRLQIALRDRPALFSDLLKKRLCCYRNNSNS